VEYLFAFQQATIHQINMFFKHLKVIVQINGHGHGHGFPTSAVYIHKSVKFNDMKKHQATTHHFELFGYSK
jgi:hypothetical protein